MAKKAKKKTVDEISKTVGRIRDELTSRNVGDDLKSLRNEVESLARRVAALELPGRGSSSSAAKPRTTAARKPAASRSTAAKKPAASRSTAAKKPAASRSTAAKKPAASRSTAAKKPAASRSRSTTTRSRSTSTRSRTSGSSS